MMLSHPVLLGFVWSLLIHTLRGQLQISNQDNKVYAYSYHFQHNGTTNSKDILRTVLGSDGEFGFDHDGESIVKTFSSPNIRGFFTKGVLPAGPINHNFNSGFRSGFRSNSAIDNIKNVIQSNLQPPSASITRGLLPPVSPDIRNEFPGNFNNVNDIELNFHKNDDFPKELPTPSLPLLQNQDNFPKLPSVPAIPSLGQNDFPEIPPPPPVPSLNINLPNIPSSRNNNGANKVEKFERNTPDGGKVVGQIETFSYNPPPISNPNSNYHENAQGFRRNENFVNNNQGITGHRTQTYFRQQFRTVTPNLESNSLLQNDRLDNRNIANSNNNNNNNQWWNVLNVLGGNNNNNANNRHSVNNFNNGNNYNRAPNVNNNNNNLGRQIDQNINQIKANLNKEFNKAFGSRLSNSNNRQNYERKNNEFRQPNVNNGFNDQNQNFNTQSPDRNERNQPFIVIPFNNHAANNGFNHQENNNRHANNQSPNNNLIRRQQNNDRYINNQGINNVLADHQRNVNKQFNNDDTTRRVFNLINDVSSRLTGNPDKLTNDIGITWDDAVVPKPFNHDWSRRQSFGTGRPFSNGHSGPLNNPIEPKPLDVVKTSIETLVGERKLPVSPVSNAGDRDGNYRNVGGGGIEKFFGVKRVVEGPNSFSQNQHHGFERNFHVNSNNGYQRTNQWSTNTVRRLDTQSTRDDFSKDFIDVFRDEY